MIIACDLWGYISLLVNGFNVLRLCAKYITQSGPFMIGLADLQTWPHHRTLILRIPVYSGSIMGSCEPLYGNLHRLNLQSDYIYIYKFKILNMSVWLPQLIYSEVLSKFFRPLTRIIKVSSNFIPKMYRKYHFDTIASFFLHGVQLTETSRLNKRTYF